LAVVCLILGHPGDTSAAVMADSLPPDAMAGDWLTETRDATVRIRHDGDRYDGVIVALRDPNGPDGKPARDVHNPDPPKRDRPIVGLTILWNFRATGGGSYDDGFVYDPDSGKTYHGQATLAGLGTLKLRGYVGISLFGRTETWTRVAGPQ
jgi:uncharacterized protein (DUF2147 family)